MTEPSPPPVLLAKAGERPEWGPNQSGYLVHAFFPEEYTNVFPRSRHMRSLRHRTVRFDVLALLNIFPLQRPCMQ